MFVGVVLGLALPIYGSYLGRWLLLCGLSTTISRLSTATFSSTTSFAQLQCGRGEDGCVPFARASGLVAFVHLLFRTCLPKTSRGGGLLRHTWGTHMRWRLVMNLYGSPTRDLPLPAILWRGSCWPQLRRVCTRNDKTN
jgi:hypothetical protein